MAKVKLRDLAKIKFVAGKGGDGGMHFGPFKIPMGGNGGNGGDIYIEGATNLYDLGHINNDLVVKGNDGERGAKKNLTGRNGEDVIFKVPLITKVMNEDNQILFTISKPGERYLIARGGMGGLGNHHFKGGQVFTLEKTTNGRGGQEVIVNLELNLKADVIFVGLPNAGKSSILNELTNANSKTAPYAFTTLEPVLGTIDGITFMDLPGLIEGTFEGKGLGTKFKKHAETAKVLAHFLSLESQDLAADYQLIRNEIKNVSEKLDQLDEIIVLTKSDLVSKEELDSKIEVVKKLGKKYYITSAYDYDSLQELKEALILKLK